MLLSNAFSIQMLTGDSLVRYTFISQEKASEILKEEVWVSVVGHKELAGILTEMFGTEIAFNRVSNKLRVGDKMLVAQYMGGRLPEGATELPEGAKLQFVVVEIVG